MVNPQQMVAIIIKYASTTTSFPAAPTLWDLSFLREKIQLLIIFSSLTYYFLKIYYGLNLLTLP